MKKLSVLAAFSFLTLASAVALAHGGGKGPRGARMDENGDGKVTLAEAQAAAKKRFEHFDKNRDGVITKDELGGGFHPRFEFADANGDGKVTLAEAQQKAKEFFTKADANKDNVLTHDEMAAAWKAHRGEGKGHCRDK
jgi:hypothetical protein